MSKIIEWLSGKKTFLCVLLGLVATVLYWLKVIPFDFYQQSLIVLGLGGAAALRSAIK